jgi:tripartite-type tricarboxylate transporter receptor subunit TctC
MVDAGKVRRLAVTSEKRFVGLPDLPTVSETVPGVIMNGWFAIVAPVSTPADIITRLNRSIGEYLDESEIKGRLISFGLATEGAGTPQSTAQFIHGEQEQWRMLAQELNIQPQ